MRTAVLNLFSILFLLVSCDWGKSGAPIVEAPSIGSPVERPSGQLGTFVESATALPVQLQNSASIQIGNKIYLVGGVKDPFPGAVTDEILVATINDDGSITGFTDSGLSLEKARRAAQIQRIGNYVYVFGGLDSLDDRTDSIERAACSDSTGLEGDFVEISQTLDEARYNFLTLVTPGYVYAIGGGTDVLQSNTVSRATIDMNTGELTSSFVLLDREEISAGQEVRNGLVEGRWTHGGIRLGNNFYILGGEGMSSIERVVINADGTLGNFELMPTGLTTNRNRLSVVALFGRAYVYGGWNGSFLATVESAPIVNDELGEFSVDGDVTLAVPAENGAPLLTAAGAFLFGGYNHGSGNLNTIQFAPIEAAE
jgi:hypothetical protein